MFANDPAEYPEPNPLDASREVLLPEQEKNDNALPSAPPPHKAMQCRPILGDVGHMMWWLTKYFADHVDLFNRYAALDNDESTERQLKFQDSRNLSVFVITPNVDGTG